MIRFTVDAKRNPIVKVIRIVRVISIFKRVAKIPYNRKSIAREPNR